MFDLGSSNLLLGPQDFNRVLLGGFPGWIGSENYPDKSGNHDGAAQQERETPLERPLQRGFSTIQPAPRTFLMTLAPSFLRTPWIRKSTALLSTSSFQP